MSEAEGRPSFSLSSRKKWFYISLLIAVLNPVFSGLILGLSFLSENETRKEGKIILAVSVIWAVVAYLAVDWLERKGILSKYRW